MQNVISLSTRYAPALLWSAIPFYQGYRARVLQKAESKQRASALLPQLNIELNGFLETVAIVQSSVSFQFMGFGRFGVIEKDSSLYKDTNDTRKWMKHEIGHLYYKHAIVCPVVAAIAAAATTTALHYLKISVAISLPLSAMVSFAAFRLAVNLSEKQADVFAGRYQHLDKLEPSDES